jgi:TPR repeat protein
MDSPSADHEPGGKNGLKVESPAAAFWEIVGRHVAEVEAIPIEEFQRRSEKVQEYQTKLSILVDQLIEQKNQPDPEVWHALGAAYRGGNGAHKNRGEAIRWFRRAAEAGHAKAMMSLGSALRYPDHWCEGAEAESLEWARKAAELGSTSGMNSLGFAYREGTGVPCDPQQAVAWFIKAVEAGDGHSLVYAGAVYARQLASPGEAEKCYLRAAEAGYKESFFELAMLYDDRTSPLHDPVEAVKWFKIVAEQKDGSRPRALLALARHCRDGIGTAQDLKTAREWLTRLLAVASPKADEYREATSLLAEIEGDLL